MPLKRNITAEEFEALADVLQEHYTQVGDEYVLDVEGIPDTKKLERSLSRERASNNRNAERIRELESELEEINKSRSEKDRDLDKVTAGFNKRIADLEKKHGEELAKRDTFITKQLKSNFAMTVATEISKVPKLLAPLIENRLAVDMDGDEPTLVILDSSGNPSDLRPEQLKKEFLTNPDFKEIVLASRASGGRAETGRDEGHGRASPASKSTSLLDLSTAELKERVAARAEAEGL